MVEISANSVVCPHCHDVFEYNKVNGIALLEIIQTIEARKRMYCRLTLDSLERTVKDEATFKLVKKTVLDGYNDLTRDIHTTLGFGNTAE